MPAESPAIWVGLTTGWIYTPPKDIKNASKHQKQRMQLKQTATVVYKVLKITEPKLQKVGKIKNTLSFSFFQVTGQSPVCLPSRLHLEETCETETCQTWLLRLVLLVKPLEVFTSKITYF